MRGERPTGSGGLFPEERVGSPIRDTGRASLLTGYLGTAVATSLRLQVSFLFPLAFGALVDTGALYLLDARLRDLIPLRR